MHKCNQENQEHLATYLIVIHYNKNINSILKIDNEGTNIFLITGLNYTDVSEQMLDDFSGTADLPKEYSLKKNILKSSDLKRLLISLWKVIIKLPVP